MKFALRVETVLNCIPQPEYRQLMVEALMILSLVVETYPKQSLGEVIAVDEIVKEAHLLFLEDQVFNSALNMHFVEPTNQHALPLTNNLLIYVVFSHTFLKAFPPCFIGKRAW